MKLDGWVANSMSINVRRRSERVWSIAHHICYTVKYICLVKWTVYKHDLFMPCAELGLVSNSSSPHSCHLALRQSRQPSLNPSP